MDGSWQYDVRAVKSIVVRRRDRDMTGPVVFSLGVPGCL